MEHLLSTRNWQGCVLFTQSPESSSLSSHLSLNSFGFIPMCAEMRVISALLKVGVIVLQQLAHSVQFTSRHTVASTLATSSDISSGTISSNLSRKADSDFLFRAAVI